MPCSRSARPEAILTANAIRTKKTVIRRSVEPVGRMRRRRLPPLPVLGTHVSHHRCWPWDLDPWVELNNGRTLTLYDLGRIPMAQRTGLIGKSVDVGPSNPIMRAQLPADWSAQALYDNHEVLMLHGQKCWKP